MAGNRQQRRAASRGGGRTAPRAAGALTYRGKIRIDPEADVIFGKDLGTCQIAGAPYAFRALNVRGIRRVIEFLGEHYPPYLLSYGEKLTTGALMVEGALMRADWSALKQFLDLMLDPEVPLADLEGPADPDEITSVVDHIFDTTSGLRWQQDLIRKSAERVGRAIEAMIEQQAPQIAEAIIAEATLAARNGEGSGGAPTGSVARSPTSMNGS